MAFEEEATVQGLENKESIFWTAICTNSCPHSLSNLPRARAFSGLDSVKHLVCMHCYLIHFDFSAIRDCHIISYYFFKASISMKILFSIIYFVAADDITWFVLHSVVNDLCMYLTKHWSVYGSQTNTDTLPSSSSSSTAISSAGNSVWMNMFLHAWLGFLHGCCKCAHKRLYTPSRNLILRPSGMHMYWMFPW